jgi:predicted MPP superfamily phosphohydrolase
MTAVMVVATLGAVVILYAWLEAGWLRTRVLEVPLPDLPEALDGVRIGHLSDFHLGARLSLGNRAGERAAAWVAARRPNLVCITGDLVSHPRGEPRLRKLLAGIERPYVVLGNHDVAITRDPFSRAAELRDLASTTLLGDEARTQLVRGQTVCVVGVDPISYHDRRARPHERSESAAAFRLLLCHFPGIADRIPDGSFDLILAGHLHAGQICVPGPRRPLTLAHRRARYVAGLYETGAGVMHVSPGTGTTFVPFRLLARPEATELVLRRSATGRGAPGDPAR